MLSSNQSDIQLLKSSNHLIEALSQSSSAVNFKLDTIQELFSELQKSHDSVTLQKNSLQAQFNQLLAWLPTALICIDKYGTVVSTNAKADQLFNISIHNQMWINVIQNYFEKENSCLKLKSGRYVEIYTTSNHENFENKNNPLPWSQIIVLCDITDQKNLQSAAFQQHRLSDLGKMSAILAHQIRTPLSALRLYFDQYSTQKNISESDEKITQKISKQITHIESQIRDMLFYVKKEIPCHENQSIKHLIQNAIQQTADIQSDIEVELIASIDLEKHIIQCHQDALVGALSNILMNAIEASQQQSKIQIVVEKLNNMLRIIVRDSGKGFDPNKINEYRNMFFTTKKQGTGLGLTVAFHIVEAHKGTIELKKNDFGGGEVVIQLPFIK
ncbi:MAG: ATP-binding protein [Pseudomonadota bacterium]